MASTTNEKLAIVNPVLRRLKVPALDTLNTESPNDTVEELVANDFSGIVQEILEMIPWACVAKRDSSLTADSNHVSDEFDYGWELPSDFVRLIGEPLYNGYPVNLYTFSRQHWRIVGNKLETKFTGPDILYVHFDPTADYDGDAEGDDPWYPLLDSNLKETIRAKCAAYWAFALTDDPSLARDLKREFQVQARLARGINARKLRRLIVEGRHITASRLRGY